MNYERWLPELSVCPVFDGLEPEEILSVLTDMGAEIVHFHKGDPALVRGETLKGFGIFLNTTPPQTPRRRKEKWRYPGVATPGWIFAELPGFSSNPVAVREFTAPEECDILFINGDRFVFAGGGTRAHLQVLRNQFGIFARKCIALKRGRRFFTLNSPAQNLAAFLGDEAPAGGGAFRPSRDPEELAEMMMIDEEAVLAAYGELIRLGLAVREEDGLVSIPDVNKLKNYQPA
jgi:hypothetical protein